MVSRSWWTKEMREIYIRFLQGRTWIIFAPFLLFIFSYRSLVFPFGGQGFVFYGRGEEDEGFFPFFFFLWLRFFSQISAILSSPLSLYFSFFISSYNGQGFSPFSFASPTFHIIHFSIYTSLLKNIFILIPCSRYILRISLLYMFLVLHFSCSVLFLT